ncbi:uncharacterized protein LOC108091838 [Drosophila ficusphila]|uniref:uncharacterized protein LOC108091838 n=1 Tax=Drosophila ficusphila TaxID=30025 RepID=UPI0007E87399|nr:uncharacterized protein LOC108091838 [Drosophila ficusphila]XP_017046708.1 uncharacterized protein LOC108091838 [Drosophila ficusphila]
MAMRALVLLAAIGLVAGEGLRLPDQQSSSNIQQVYAPQPQIQQIQQPQQIPQQQQQQPGVGEERGRSSLLSIFGLGNDNDPYLARTNSNCLGGDLSECFKTQALNTFDEIFFRDHYKLTDFARVVRLPETQQRSLQQEPFEYAEDPELETADDSWNQLLKYGLRRAERFVKSTALEVEWPEELTEAGRYEARFIGNDIDGELDLIDDGQRAGHFSRKKLKKMIIPLLLVLKIFKLKLLLFLPFILGIVGLKKILGLAAIILPGLFAYFKLCRPPGGVSGAFGGGLSSLFGGKPSFPQYSPQGVGAATYYHHHEHFEGGHGGAGPYYRQEPSFAKPYTDYYSKSYQGQEVQGQQQVPGNSVSFGDPQEAAYNGYYGRNSGKDIAAEQQPQKS